MNDKEDAIQNVIKCGFKRILTSGKPGKAIENFHLIKKLQEKYKDQINIMPGGGIRSSNVETLIDAAKDGARTSLSSGG